MGFWLPTRLLGCATMGYLTRCVLSWEISRRFEDYLSRRRFLARHLPFSLCSKFTTRIRYNEAVRVLAAGARTVLHAEIESHLRDLISKLVFRSAQPLLEATQKLVLFALGKRQIVVS